MKPVWKWAIGIVAGLILLLLSSAWYLGNRWKAMVDSRLQEAVVNVTDSLYRITYIDIDFSLLTGNASLTGVRLTLYSAVYERREQQELAADLTYGFTAQR